MKNEINELMKGKGGGMNDRNRYKQKDGKELRNKIEGKKQKK